MKTLIVIAIAILVIGGFWMATREQSCEDIIAGVEKSPSYLPVSEAAKKRVEECRNE